MQELLSMVQVCPLCQMKAESSVQNQFMKDRKFFHCQRCDLIFLPCEKHISAEEEKTRYQTHQNNPQDLGYREFLMRFARPVLDFLEKENKSIKDALDYGSGAGSPLSSIFGESKIKVWEYDPYFKPNENLLQKKYDLVMATEVIEHFRNPALDFLKMKSLLKGQGILALMTQFHQGPVHFFSWWYPKDFTHVSFYSEKTLRFWAGQQGMIVNYLKDPVVIFSLPPQS